MLVLSRKIGDALVIGDSRVEVTALDGLTAELKIVTSVKGESQTKHASLKKNESTSIDAEEATIVVVEIREVEPSVLKVRLGVEAPKETPVHRQEVYDAIKRHESEEEDDTDKQNEFERQLAQSDPAAHIAIDFGPGFSDEEVEACLGYLSEVYRLRGGVGLKVVRSQTMVPEESEVPYAS